MASEKIVGCLGLNLGSVLTHCTLALRFELCSCFNNKFRNKADRWKISFDWNYFLLFALFRCRGYKIVYCWVRWKFSNETNYRKEANPIWN